MELINNNNILFSLRYILNNVSICNNILLLLKYFHSFHIKSSNSNVCLILLVNIFFLFFSLRLDIKRRMIIFKIVTRSLLSVSKILVLALRFYNYAIFFLSEVNRKNWLLKGKTGSPVARFGLRSMMQMMSQAFSASPEQGVTRSSGPTVFTSLNAFTLSS